MKHSEITLSGAIIKTEKVLLSIYESSTPIRVLSKKEQ